MVAYMVKLYFTSRLLTVIDGGGSFLKCSFSAGAGLAFSSAELGLISSNGAHQAVHDS